LEHPAGRGLPGPAPTGRRKGPNGLPGGFFRSLRRLYFGLEGTESLTLEQIGGLFDLTRERVRQLKEQALSKLRAPARYPAFLALEG
jgi:hypothetical protein